MKDDLKGYTLTPSDIARFWGHVDKSGDCWIWRRSLTAAGYGQFAMFRDGQKGSLLAHRVVFALSGRRLGRGMQVDHICRTRSCVNPDHLREVTRHQNAQNQSPDGHSVTGSRGVTWLSKRGRYRVQATLNGKTYYGGFFTDPAEARQAAIALRNRLYSHNDADRLEPTA